MLANTGLNMGLRELVLASLASNMSTGHMQLACFGALVTITFVSLESSWCSVITISGLDLE